MKHTAQHELLRTLSPSLSSVPLVELPLRGFRRQFPVFHPGDLRANLLTSLIVCELLVSPSPIANWLRRPCRRSGGAPLARTNSPILASPRVIEEILL